MPDQSADDSDIRWLSYHQIAGLRGISRASAERMVRKHRWRRTVNNHGVTVAAVPLDYAEPERSNPPERPRERSGEIRPDLSALERAIDTLREQLVRERDRGDIATTERDAVREEIAGLRVQLAEVRIAAEGRVQALEAEISAAREAAAAAVTRADRSDATVSAERVRTDDLRSRLEAAQADLAAARGAAGRADAQAEAAQAKAREAARLLEAAQAGGRWARLRRAWRGEGAG
jgi:predicted  nucleic acid-binding Zn-ribbon protein